ncbi:hypothetical protein ACIQGW_13545 [Lysinibacillus xylanilyticus]|uniref:hypothetical protein n=1 Tax=Lysinibacillus xylanilyticus TaxID=582475 RepID=UPI0013792C0E
MLSPSTVIRMLHHFVTINGGERYNKTLKIFMHYHQVKITKYEVSIMLPSEYDEDKH